MNKTLTSSSLNKLKMLLKIAIILALLTVVISSYIRLAESGVGCEPWPACYGHYPNNESAHGINVLIEKGAGSPLRAARISHRLVTTVLGAIVLYLFIISWFKKYSTILGRWVPSILLLLTIILSSIGRIHPSQPLPVLTLSNFLGGLLLVALIYYLYSRVANNHPDLRVNRQKIWIRFGILFILLQILWGGWSSANYSGASCETLLSCDSIELIEHPAADTQESAWSLKLDQHNQVIIEEQTKKIQMIHHIFAIFNLFYTVLLVLLTRRSEPQLHNYCILMCLLLFTQFLIGVIALNFRLPISITLAHNFMAALLMIFLTSFNLKLSSRKTL